MSYIKGPMPMEGVAIDGMTKAFSNQQYFGNPLHGDHSLPQPQQVSIRTQFLIAVFKPHNIKCLGLLMSN